MKKTLFALLAMATSACLLFCSCMSKEAKQKLDEKINEGYVETMDNSIKIEKVSNVVFKTDENANPISPDIFCADPTAVEYEGRLYVYATNDHQQYEVVGAQGKNTYGEIKSFVIFSTDDMVNWTYHGIIDTAKIAPWIYTSWAPSITSRVEEDGLTHFYLYFSNSGAGVGVLTATNPVGPWSDPLGKPLISSETEGLNGCPNPFDPGVCIDDNGVGWLSFGGGKPGSDYMPGSSRIVKLGKDMISLDSEIAKINAPYFFEASELNFINGTYVYTFNTSWDERLEWDITTASRPSACSMAYMTTTTPLDTDSWVFRGEYFKNPGLAGLDHSNNHTHLHKFGGKYYMLHHTLLKQSEMATDGGFRSLGVVEMVVNEDLVAYGFASPDKVGVTSIKPLNPYNENLAHTVFNTSAVDYLKDENGLVYGIISDGEGAWLKYKDVDFAKKASVFTAMVEGNGRIEVRIDDVNSECVGFIEFENSEFKGVYSELEELSGKHDLYLVFSNEDIKIKYWQFL